MRFRHLRLRLPHRRQGFRFRRLRRFHRRRRAIALRTATLRFRRRNQILALHFARVIQFHLRQFLLLQLRRNLRIRPCHRFLRLFHARLRPLHHLFRRQFARLRLLHAAGSRIRRQFRQHIPRLHLAALVHIHAFHPPCIQGGDINALQFQAPVGGDNVFRLPIGMLLLVNRKTRCARSHNRHRNNPFFHCVSFALNKAFIIQSTRCASASSVSCCKIGRRNSSGITRMRLNVFAAKIGSKMLVCNWLIA